MTYASVVQPVHDAIRAGYPLYLERARNGDDIDRAGAYELLGDLPEACPEALPLLLERATAESDGRLQLIALDALRKLAPYATEEQREGLLTRMLNIMSDEHLPFGTRIAAVRTLAGTAPQRLPAWTPDLFVAQAQERARQMGPDTISLSFSEAVCVLEQRHDLLRRSPGQRPAAAAVAVGVDHRLPAALLGFQPRALRAEGARADGDVDQPVGARRDRGQRRAGGEGGALGKGGAGSGRGQAGQRGRQVASAQHHGTHEVNRRRLQCRR